MQPLDALIRRADLAGISAADCRFVVTQDGRAAVIAGDGKGGFYAPVQAFGAEWRTERDGRIVIATASGEWVGQRDTRCGNCGGRYALRNLDASAFLPQLEQSPAEPESAEPLAAPAYGDTY